MAAVRAALIRDPANDQTDAGRQPHPDHQRDIHRPWSSGELNEDVTVLHLDGETGHLDRGVVRVGAGRDVPAPGVPRAQDESAFEVAFAQRSAAMGTRIVDRVIGPVDVEQRQILALDLDDPALPSRYVAYRRESNTPSRQSLAFRSPRRSAPPNLAPSKTTAQVVVHHAGRLHESVTDRRADELEAPAEKIATYGA